MGRRGQVTLFVIIAIIIVVAIALIAFLPSLGEKPATSPETMTSINSYVQECVESTAGDGIYLLGMQGGYTILPEKYFKTNFSIAYGYYEGSEWFPTLSKMTDQLDIYIELMLPKCPDWGKWPDWTISPADVKATSAAGAESVQVKVSWPITLKKGATTLKLEEFSAEIPVRLRMIHNISEGIISHEISSPDTIDLSYLIDSGTKYNLKINPVFYNSTIVYSITDPASTIDNQPYVFMFANKFT